MATANAGPRCCIAAAGWVVTLVTLLFSVTAGALEQTSYPLALGDGPDPVTVGAPEAFDWPDLRRLSVRFPLQGGGFRGHADVSAQTEVDFERRIVRLVEPASLDLNWPDEQRVAELRERLLSDIGESRLNIGLDSLLDDLPVDFELPERALASPRLNFQPPRIVVANGPMRLMLIDGPPANVPIEPTGLEFVVNTDWDVFRDAASGRWFILDNGHWIMNNMLSSGDWISTTDLPPDFLTLQVSSDWPRVARAMPPREPKQRPVPITISYEPTELILVDGEPRLETVTGNLQYVANTESDLFLVDGRWYYLAAGRWFSTKSLKRQWQAVKQLPAEFSVIPRNHRSARVLSTVPGTRAARRAAIEAAIPRVASATAGSASQLEIPYLGEPSFVEIQGTDLRRAENTPFQVIMHNNFYYLCYKGAWYASPRPQGPWNAASRVPEAIYTIPPTDPAYNVTFVRLDAFDDSSGRAAYVSTSGYYNRYYTGSTVVYGTGWYYPGYHDRYAYWRYPHTYGYRGLYGHPSAYPYPQRVYSETFDVENEDADWEWNLDGNKRRVYRYGPPNRVGETYRMPDRSRYDGDGR
jgi:hypothetical protein